MSYGRTEATESPVRDQSVWTAGAALILVGLAEAMFGFLLFTSCTSYFNDVCTSHESAGAGFVLGVAGVIVLIGGGIVYLLGRRSIRS
jgi:nitrate reductase gamma subunit